MNFENFDRQTTEEIPQFIDAKKFRAQCLNHPDWKELNFEITQFSMDLLDLHDRHVLSIIPEWHDLIGSTMISDGEVMDFNSPTRYEVVEQINKFLKELSEKYEIDTEQLKS